jgi:DNA-binding transcriptional MerR regulator
MRLAELSRRSGIPRSTIKYYLREGLLPAGAPTARNQASYGPQHVERLALIRALRDVAGLPLDAIARVTRELERGWEGDAIAEALQAVGGKPVRALAPEDEPELAKLRAEVRAFVAALPWDAGDERHRYVDEIAASLWQVRRYLLAGLARYAQIAWLLSEAEYELVPGGAPTPVRARGDDLAEPTRRAILGSLLFERIFVALRRSANAMRAVRVAEGLELPPTRAR